MPDEGLTNAYVTPEFRSAFVVGEVVAGNYEIVGMAGTGGMGVVYRARDLKLQRIVALKFLPAEVNSSAIDKQRFLKEARIASSLDHVNIGAIHGIEETPDGRAFIVMAYYDGLTLADRIHAGEPIQLSEALDIAAQMARGLRDAHTHNVIHRDIKPSNVILTSSGIAKIVDFGVAHTSGQTATLAQGGGGTLAYMSPEQGLNKSCDHRTDIWAWGIVFAEMLTGQNPLQRDSLSATVVAVLSEAPSGLDDLPVELQQIIYRALSKDPEKRYQNCSEILHDLEQARVSLAETGSFETTELKKSKSSTDIRRFREQASKSAWLPQPQPRFGWRFWTIAAGLLVLLIATVLLIPQLRERLRGLLFATPTRHVAVLPFDNVGNNPENQELVAGLMDSLTGKLSNLDAGDQPLWVVPASEVRRRNITDPTSALRELGATLVVKGSVQRDGKEVHLNANLIDTKNMRQIGSVEVSDPIGDLAALQNEVVPRLARLMNISVTSKMLRDTGGSANPAAYEDYLTALGYMQRYDKPGNLDLAIQALENSVSTDPRFALGFAQLGEAYRLKYRVESNPKWFDKAQAACEKAVEIDDSIPTVYVTLGRLHESSGKTDLALQEFQRALQINPRDAAAEAGMAHMYEAAGRTADAEAAFQKVIALRPDWWDGYDELGNFYGRQGKYTDAIQQYRKAIELTPDNAQVYANLGGTYIDAGDPKMRGDAEQALKKSLALSPSYAAYANIGDLYLIEQRYAESAAATEKALQLQTNDYLVWDNLKLAYEWLDDKLHADAAREQMLNLLEQTLKLKPQDALAHSTLAIVYAQDKSPEKALAHIQTSLALAPDDPDVLASVGEAYEIMGDRRQAVSNIQKALRKGYSFDKLRVEPALQRIIADPTLIATK